MLSIIGSRFTTMKLHFSFKDIGNIKIQYLVAQSFKERIQRIQYVGLYFLPNCKHKNL